MVVCISVKQKYTEKKLTAKEPKPTAPTNAANQPSTRFGSAIVMFTSSAYDDSIIVALLFFYQAGRRKLHLRYVLMAYSKIRPTPHYLVLIPTNLCLIIL